nr:hypothetical protein [Tanacetum cinerariifolium]
NCHSSSSFNTFQDEQQETYCQSGVLQGDAAICLRIPNQTFDELPFKEEILAFLRYHGHSGEIKKITNKNVDFAYLLWEDFVYQVKHKDAKKSNEMYYPRFTKVIINFFMTKDPSITRRNKMFTTIKLVLRHQNTQQFGAILHVELINKDIRNSADYKEYYAIASGAAPPKTKASNCHSSSSFNTFQDEQQETYCQSGVLQGDAAICLRIPNQTFDELPFKEEILAFLRYHGHSGEIKKITNKNVDFAYLLWEDFVYQVKHKDAKKSNEMYYPRFTKVIINFFMTKDPSITRRNKMFTTIKLVLRHQNTQQFGAAPPKTKASVRKTQSSSDITMPPPIAASTRLSTSAKGVPNVPTDESDEEVSWKLSDKDDDDDVDDQSDVADDDDDDDDDQEDEDNNDDESHGMNVVGDEGPDAKDDDEELYRDVNINLEGRDSLSVSSQIVMSMFKPSLDVDFINKIDENIQKIIKEQVKTSYDVAADLSEMELKKILIEKMESNMSIHRLDEQRNLYKALVDAYECDKIILDTYEDIVTLKRRRNDADKDEEPFAGSDQGSKRRRERKEPESTSAPKDKESKTTDTLKPELLVGPTYELMKGSCKSLVELEFFLEEVYKAKTNQLDSNNPEGQQYPHNLLKPLPLEFGKFTSKDGESLESYYSRFYKMMNELIRNKCKVTNHQVNVQFLLQLQPKWQRTMDITIDQQVALDEALVPHASILRIGKSNFRLRSDITSKESTLQLVYDVLRLTPFYKAFMVTADVPEIYMQESWVTATVHHHSIRFKMDNTKRIVNLEYFREMVHICPRLPGQTFNELPFEEEILAFLIFLGHIGE